MSSDKTEQPTPKRIREAREKGDVCKSQDLPTAATVLGITFYLIVMGPDILKKIIYMGEVAYDVMRTPFREALGLYGKLVVELSLSIVVPLVFFLRLKLPYLSYLI